ncbi:MAG: threonylcarbamoyl-AMP synthase [Nitrosarchaeum sp.]|nr:threonylcarbamoyl-AMP synthase [Nitrosarchaeum sp.]
MKVSCDKEGIEKASQVVEKEGVIIFPTDTVYGIGCNPYSKSAIEKIYKIKSREKSKQLPVLVFSKEIASKIADFDKHSERIAEKFWPGPLTLVLKLTDDDLRRSLNLGEKIAIRVPDSKCALDLLEKCSFLVGTSANISGEEPFTDPSDCYQSIRGFDLFLDGGKISGGVASTVVEIINGELNILREGVLTREEIAKIL